MRFPFPRQQGKAWGAVWGTAMALIVLPILAILGNRQFGLAPFSIPSDAMAPTLLGEKNHGQGDGILVERGAYWLAPPQRGDIAAFDGSPYPPLRASFYVKRIVGLPGEAIQIDPPYVLVNGKRLDSPGIFREISTPGGRFPGYANSHRDYDGRLNSPQERIVLGSGEYFLLDDNSPSGLDSRYIGPVKKTDIVGKACLFTLPRDAVGG